MNTQKDGHDETDNIPSIDGHFQDNQDNNKDADYQDLRAEHKRVALKLQQEMRERRQRNDKALDQTIDTACGAADEGDEFCDGVQDTITGHDELYSRRVHKFYKAQDYYEQKRDAFLIKLDKWLAHSFDPDGHMLKKMKAYTERLDSYCTNVDCYTMQEDSLEYAALLEAHKEMILLRRKRDAVWYELEARGKSLVQTVNLLIGWQIERHHYMPRRDNDVCQRTPIKVYHYRWH